MTEADHRQLAARASGGDRAAFEVLFREHRERVAGYLRNRLGARLRIEADRDDVVQEVSLRAFRSIGSFRWTRDDCFFRWLVTIADHVLLEAARKSRRRGDVEGTDDVDVADDAVSASRAVARDERLERLRRALDRLSPEHREVILLTRIERLPSREVARRMGRSPNAVAQLLRRAVAKLRGEFGDTRSLGLPPEGLFGDRADPELWTDGS